MSDREPTETDLYRLYDKAGSLLYVGISYSAIRRQADHKRSKQWFHEVAEITIEKHPTREAAQLAERIAIYDERPQHNVAHNIRRGPWAAPRATTPAAWDGRKSSVDRWLREHSFDLVRPFLSVGDCGAFGLDRGRVAIGLVEMIFEPTESFPDHMVFLAPYVWQYGYFGENQMSFVFREVETCLLALEVDPNSRPDASRLPDFTTGQVFDIDPLSAFRTDWLDISADRRLPMERDSDAPTIPLTDWEQALARASAKRAVP